MSEFKNNIILETSTEIADFINDKYGLGQEELYIEIAEFINCRMRFLFDTIEELGNTCNI